MNEYLTDLNKKRELVLRNISEAVFSVGKTTDDVVDRLVSVAIGIGVTNATIEKTISKSIADFKKQKYIQKTEALMKITSETSLSGKTSIQYDDVSSILSEVEFAEAVDVGRKKFLDRYKQSELALLSKIQTAYRLSDAPDVSSLWREALAFGIPLEKLHEQICIGHEKRIDSLNKNYCDKAFHCGVSFVFSGKKCDGVEDHEFLGVMNNVKNSGCNEDIVIKSYNDGIEKAFSDRNAFIRDIEEIYPMEWFSGYVLHSVYKLIRSVNDKYYIRGSMLGFSDDKIREFLADSQDSSRKEYEGKAYLLFLDSVENYESFPDEKKRSDLIFSAGKYFLFFEEAIIDDDIASSFPKSRDLLLSINEVFVGLFNAGKECAEKRKELNKKNIYTTDFGKGYWKLSSHLRVPYNLSKRIASLGFESHEDEEE